MIRLYHFPLSPFCRKVRLTLAEKKLEVELIEERYWEPSPDFLRRNPAGKVPVLRVDQKVMSESQAICEYLEEAYPNPPLMPRDQITSAFSVAMQMLNILTEQNVQRSLATLGPLISVLLFLAAIISAFWYLRNEEFEREQEAVKRDAEIAMLRAGGGPEARARAVEPARRKVESELAWHVICRRAVDFLERLPR